MIALTLPPLRSGTWLGITVEIHEVATFKMVAVTIRPRAGQPLERRWFAHEPAAIEWALDQADSRNLPLFDFREGEIE